MNLKYLSTTVMVVKDDVMKRFIRGLQKPSTLIPMLFMLCLGFLVAAQFLSTEVLSIITAAIAIAVSTLIMIAYIPVFIYVARHERRVEEQNLFMGIILLFGAIEAWNIWRVAFTIFDRPEWMIGHWFPSLLSLIASMTGFYFLSAPDVARMGWRYSTIAMVLSVLFATIGILMFEAL